MTKNSNLKKISALIIETMRPDAYLHGRDPFINLDIDDWALFIEKCHAEGLSGLIYDNLTRQSRLSDIDSTAKQALETDFLTNYGRNTILELELQNVAQHLNQENICSLLIRGGSLFNKIYPSLGARPLLDLDFVIRKDDLPKAQSCLEYLGYSFYPDYPYFYFKEGIYIDIHLDTINFWRVESMQSLISPNNKILWSRSQLFHNLLHIRILDTYDALICTADHMLWHSFERLIWFMDIYFLLNTTRRPFVWQELFGRAEKLGHLKSLIYAFHFVDFHKIYNMPNEGKHILRSQKLSIADKKTVFYLKENTRHMIAGELLAFLSIKSFFQKVKALGQIIFIPRSKFPNATSQRNALTYIKRFITIMCSAARKFFYLIAPSFLTERTK